MLDIDMTLKGFGPEEAKKLDQAGRILKAVVNSEEFKNRVCSAHYYRSGKRYDGFYQCDLTPTEAYNRFMSGVDKFNKDADDDIDIYITLYYSSGSVIGYTYGNTWHTWLNSKFLRLWWKTPQNIAGNLGHEYCHNVSGIDKHTKKWTALRKYSAPYAIGYIVAELGEKYVTTEDITAPEISGKYRVCRPRFRWFPWIFKKCKWVNKTRVV